MKKNFDLLKLTDKGLYCEKGDFYIDPHRVVPKAIITHAHSDHARAGMGEFLSHKDSVPLLKLRLGKNINIRGLEYNEKIKIKDVTVSLHPSGHVIGSSQVRVEYKGEVWVVAGDYKLQDDNLTTPFEVVKCNVFITESTFGLPVYKWKEQHEVFSDINKWWEVNKEKGKNTVIYAYSLGKAQRLIQNVDHSIGKIYTNDSIENMNEAIRSSGIKLKPTTRISENKIENGSLIITPHSIKKTGFLETLGKYAEGEASGWMTHKIYARYLDKGIILSDHADHDELQQAVIESGADRVYVTHGFSEQFARTIRVKYGIFAEEISSLNKN